MSGRKKRHQNKGGCSKRDKNFPRLPKTTKERDMNFRQIHRGCVDKRRYYTKRFAREAAKRAGLNFYHCPFCSFWHLTSRGTPEKVGEEDHNRPWQPKGK